MKKQIVEESALNVGYYESVIPEIIEKIDPDTFFKLMGMDSGEWLLAAAKSKDRAQFQNILVSEAVKHMSYSEFKSIANFFFNYKETNQEVIANPLELSDMLFQKIQQQSEQIFAPDKNETQEAEEPNFEDTKERILDDLEKAQSEFRESMVSRTPEAIFDQASKILYVTDSLLEVEAFLDDFNEEDYEDRSYSYDKQLSALFDRYSSNPPENGSQSFIAAAEDAWADSPTNYETGTDDKSDFMERYVANYFELSPHLKAKSPKVTEPAKVSPTITKSPTL